VQEVARKRCAIEKRASYIYIIDNDRVKNAQIGRLRKSGSGDKGGESRRKTVGMDHQLPICNAGPVRCAGLSGDDERGVKRTIVGSVRAKIRLR